MEVVHERMQSFFLYNLKQQKEILWNDYLLWNPLNLLESVLFLYSALTLIQNCISPLFSHLSLSFYLPLSVILLKLKAIVTLKPSETVEERPCGVESHPGACGF